jgi:hypothetical protein
MHRWDILEIRAMRQLYMFGGVVEERRFGRRFGAWKERAMPRH